MENKTNYQLTFEKHCDSLLGIVEHAIASTANSSIEIAARAIALAAPLPNAINLANVVTNDLGWGMPAAVSFAVTIEIVVFFLVEVALLQFDGYLEEPGRYGFALPAMVATLVVGASVVMVIVYQLETHKIMALLPLISICAFVGIGFKRWHERNQIKVSQSHDAEVNTLSSKVYDLTVQIGEYKDQIERQNKDIVDAQRERVKLEKELAIQSTQNDVLVDQIAGVRSEFERYREQVNKQLSERQVQSLISDKSTRKGERQKNSKIDGAFERRIRVLDMWKQSSELSLKEVADQIGVSKTTISNDLRWLEDAEVIHRTVNNETGKTVVYVNGNEASFRAGELN